LKKITQATAKFKSERVSLNQKVKSWMNEKFLQTTCITAAYSIISIVSQTTCSKLRSSDDAKIYSHFQNSHLKTMKTSPMCGMKPRQGIKEWNSRTASS
jgi:hypothetical protein